MMYLGNSFNSVFFRSFFIRLFCLCVTVSAYSQTNLVQNGGVEAPSGFCPTSIIPGELEDKFNSKPPADAWARPQDKFWQNNLFRGSNVVASSDAWCTGFEPTTIASSGNKCLHFLANPSGDHQYREIVINELAGQGVLNNHKYVFRIQVNVLNGSLNPLGIQLSSKYPYQNKKEKGANLYDTGNSIRLSLSSAQNLGTVGNGYVQLQMEFVSNQSSNLKYLAITAFDNVTSPHKFLVDNVELLDLGEVDPCPPTQYVQNETFPAGLPIRSGDQSLRAGFAVGAPFPAVTGNVVMTANSKSVFKAGNEVTLEDGFETQHGADFLAYIAPCEESPCDPPSDLPLKEISLCTDDPQVIENALTTDFNYMSGATHGDILWSGPHLVNPIRKAPGFSIPSSNQSQGVFEYLVTFTDICGNTATQRVIFSYSSQTAAPSVVINNLVNQEYDFSFDVTVDPNVAWLEFELFDKTTGNIILGPNKLTAHVDFDPSQPFPFVGPCFPVTTVCHDYRIRVRSKNICSEAIAVQDVHWNRSSFCSPKPQLTVPNVFTPNGDGIHDCFTINVCGADAVSWWVDSRWGTRLAEGTGVPVCNNTVCLWDGGSSPDGQYVIGVSVINACGGIASPTPKYITLIR